MAPRKWELLRSDKNSALSAITRRMTSPTSPLSVYGSQTLLEDAALLPEPVDRDRAESRGWGGREKCALAPYPPVAILVIAHFCVGAHAPVIPGLSAAKARNLGPRSKIEISRPSASE